MSMERSGGTRDARALFRIRSGLAKRSSSPARTLFVPILALAAALAAALSCGRGGPDRSADGEGDGAPASRAGAAGAARTVLFIGTSLTAGYGLEPEQAFPALIQAKIDSAGLHYRVVNAGVSGETSAGALRRLDWLLRQPFAVLVLETGSNDMLRGAQLDSLEANIQAILDRVRSARPEARIVLVGMRAPPNLGLPYASRFRRVFADLAERNDVAFVPYLLDGVGGYDELNQPDGIHPNAKGQERIAENVWKVLKDELRE
jgi:acyl-CoA thioesterase-1